MIITSVNIANSFLQKSFEENVPLTVLKLNKLIYLFFRNYLKETGNILFSEPFEAWNTFQTCRQSSNPSGKNL